MSGFKLGKMTLSSIFKKPETHMYPIVETEMAPAHKGIVVNEVEKCILCSLCAKACPADALEVDKKARVWRIDRFRCVQCTTCTQNCPKNCLSMEPSRPVIATKKSWTEFVVPEQEKPAKAEKPAADAKPAADDIEAKLAGMDPEKAAKVRAAMEAKAKKAAAAAE